MKPYEFLDRDGTFRMEHPDHTSYLNFPLAGESGMKSSVTPLLGGDAKLDQNTFLLQPVSAEELHDLKATRNFWAVLEGGGAWSLTGASAEAEALKGTPEEEDLTLTAGLMWHRLDRVSKKLGLASSITSFVPRDEHPMEVLAVTLKNAGQVPVTVTPVSAVPIYGRSADNLRDHRHVTSLLHRAVVTRHGLELTPTLTFDERGHQPGTKTFYALGAGEDGSAPEAVCAAIGDFIGEGGSLTRPEAVYAYEEDSPVWRTAGSHVDGSEIVAALRFAKRTLAPGEEASWLLCLGVSDKEKRAETADHIMSTYFVPGGGERALDQVKRTWAEKTNIRCRTGDRDFDDFMVWVSFQPILRRLFGCSFLPYHDYGKGGRGWRDLWQDCLALLLMDPGEVREMLVNDYRGVRFDGTNATIIGEGKGEFKADRNGIPRVWMDHGFWPFLTTRLYLDQTGDLGLLAEEIPYFKDGQIFRSERVDEAWHETQGTELRDRTGKVVSATVLEHILIQNLTAFYDVGEHNHIRLRGADWNDGLDMAAARGESVTFTAAYAGNFRELSGLLKTYVNWKGAEAMAFSAELLPLLEQPESVFDDIAAKQAVLAKFHESCAHTLSGEKKEVKLLELAGVLEKMADWTGKHIRETEWVETSEGSFFNGYYDNAGRQVEGEFPTGVRMTLTGQVFPMMAGVASEEEIDSVIRAADALLYSEESSGYRLNTDFHEVKTDLGRAFGFAYGHKENGAVFAHMVTMYANALYRRGRVREGYKALHSLYAQAMDFDRSRCYPGLPEYFDGKGRGLYPYLTGSASWLMLTVITEMFGVRGELGDLALRPKLVDEQLDGQGRIGLSMEFDGTPIRVTYTAPARKAVYTAVREVTLDGEKIDGCVISRERLKKSAGEIKAVLE